jgi:hypothetical protein
MRKRVIRAAIFLALAIGAAIGGATAAGAFGASSGQVSTDQGIIWE